MDIQNNAAPQRTRGTGRLAARFLDGRTRLSEFFQEGSAKIRLPDSFDGRMEAVLINTSGGLTGGDRMDWRVDAAAGADITVTTQACERIYKSNGGVTSVRTNLKAGPGARIAWLPQETILFDRGRLHRELDADLAEDSELLAVESILFGRKAMGEAVEEGEFRDRWRIRRNGRLIHAEQMLLDGPIARQIARRMALGTDVSFATVLYCGPRSEAFARSLQPLLAGHQAGVSAWAGKLVVRVAASEGFELRKILIPVISHLRDGGSLPKVWSL